MIAEAEGIGRDKAAHEVHFEEIGREDVEAVEVDEKEEADEGEGEEVEEDEEEDGADDG